MTGIEIAILIVGVIFVLGSFFVGEKLSSKDIEHIAEMTKAQLNRIVEKELQSADGTIQDMVDQTIEDSVLKIERMMDKETNTKMMSISEYSDTVLKEINKAHGEVMFLYSMLNDKHAELTNLANQISQLVSLSQNTITKEKETSKAQKQKAEKHELKNHELENHELENHDTKVKGLINDEGLPTQKTSNEDKNHNNSILKMAEMGMKPIEIAKELGLGIGEVKFVMDLYKGDSKG